MIDLEDASDRNRAGTKGPVSVGCFGFDERKSKSLVNCLRRLPVQVERLYALGLRKTKSFNFEVRYCRQRDEAKRVIRMVKLAGRTLVVFTRCDFKSIRLIHNLTIPGMLPVKL